MPTYCVRWEINIEDVNSPLEAAQTALEMQRDPNSVATVFDVQIAGLDASDNWDTIDLTPEDGPDADYPNWWQLYSGRPGWEKCARRLDAALDAALLSMRSVSGHDTSDHPSQRQNLDEQRPNEGDF